MENTKVDEKKVREALAVLDSAYPENCTNHVQQLLREALAPQPRFYVGQPVLCSYTGEDWTSHNILRAGLLDSYPHVKPDLDAVSLPNWVDVASVEFVTVTAENSIINWVREDGKTGSANNIAHLGKEILRYCIIPLPEWINP